MPSCAGLTAGAARLRPPWEVIHKFKVAADCATAMVRARRVMLVVRGRACTVGGEAEDHGAVGDGGDRLSGLVAGRRERSGYSYAHWELAGSDLPGCSPSRMACQNVNSGSVFLPHSAMYRITGSHLSIIANRASSLGSDVSPLSI